MKRAEGTVAHVDDDFGRAARLYLSLPLNPAFIRKSAFFPACFHSLTRHLHRALRPPAADGDGAADPLAARQLDGYACPGGSRPSRPGTLLLEDSTSAHRGHWLRGTTFGRGNRFQTLTPLDFLELNFLPTGRRLVRAAVTQKALKTANQAHVTNRPCQPKARKISTTTPRRGRRRSQAGGSVLTD